MYFEQLLYVLTVAQYLFPAFYSLQNSANVDSLS